MAHLSGHSKFFLYLTLSSLIQSGTIIKNTPPSYQLTPQGNIRANRIIRLHRLWELYLADYLGLKPERVHKSAEEMEHILTPELEKALTELLDNPKVDPHQQPIPPSL